MQPQPAEHLPADRSPHAGSSGDREPDIRGDPRHRGARLELPLPAVVGRSEHCGAGFICPLHPLLQVGLLPLGIKQ